MTGWARYLGWLRLATVGRMTGFLERSGSWAIEKVGVLRQDERDCDTDENKVDTQGLCGFEDSAPYFDLLSGDLPV